MIERFKEDLQTVCTRALADAQSKDDLTRMAGALLGRAIGVLYGLRIERRLVDAFVEQAWVLCEVNERKKLS